MKNHHKAYWISLLFVSTLCICSCGQEMGRFVGQMAGAAVDGALAGLGNTAPDNTFQNLFGAAGAQTGLENEARQAGVDLTLIPAEWKSPDGRLVKDDRGMFCYVLGDDHLAWNIAEKCWKTED